jgi:hypothetical protein
MTDAPHSARTIATRSFTWADQIGFARFSGDTNPIHVDPVAARRLISGQCVVHGMHSLLWALDSLAKSTSLTAIELKVEFLKPAYLDEPIDCIWNEASDRLTLQANNTPLVKISLLPGQVNVERDLPTTVQAPRGRPAEPTFSECSSLPPRVFRLHGETSLATGLFPSFCAVYGVPTACEIAALSQVVGMECPGLNSLFASLRIRIRSSRGVDPMFHVVRSDGRYGRLVLAVEAHTLDGEMDAFYRPSAFTGPSMTELSTIVVPGEFRGISALVIGGSRGLGALVAKLLAAGGADLTITYSVGEAEAMEVSDEIQFIGGNCSATQLTVSRSTMLPADCQRFDQLYYFATPRIFAKRSKHLDPALTEKFRDVYVHGFESICKSIGARGWSCAILYPSTIAIEDPLPELAEYAQAKAEGERLCQKLCLTEHLVILAPRLPRMATDQTQSIVSVKAADPADTIVPLLRDMFKASRATSRGQPPAFPFLNAQIGD